MSFPVPTPPRPAQHAAPTGSSYDEEHPEHVDAALAPLEGLDAQPVADHLAAFEEAHRELRSALEL